MWFFLNADLSLAASARCCWNRRRKALLVSWCSSAAPVPLLPSAACWSSARLGPWRCTATQENTAGLYAGREKTASRQTGTHTHTQLEHHLHVLVFYLQGLCLVFWSVLISFVCCQFLHLTSDSVWVWLMSDDVLKLCLLFFAHSSDRGPFYKKQLILEQPSSACEVKVSCVQRQNKHHFSLHTCKCLILHSW